MRPPGQYFSVLDDGVGAPIVDDAAWDKTGEGATYIEEIRGETYADEVTGATYVDNRLCTWETGEASEGTPVGHFAEGRDTQLPSRHFNRPGPALQQL
jgi:hypothetical protein